MCPQPAAPFAASRTRQTMLALLANLIAALARVLAEDCAGRLSVAAASSLLAALARSLLFAGSPRCLKCIRTSPAHCLMAMLG
mmetsp:Transcript_16168/g.48458  ORF Transcript_16168/g.48458 Transcript_16168/m.48458 type:complete len:83 (-) Transcript_16168:105-353(-)